MVDLQSIKNDVFYYGADILSSEGMQSSRNFYQHGSISVYEHSVSVACVSLALSRALLIDSNERSLVRGALLHDYFLYDWHTPSHINSMGLPMQEQHSEMLSVILI
mgnify:CR=1 FL=1